MSRKTIFVVSILVIFSLVYTGTPALAKEKKPALDIKNTPTWNVVFDPSQSGYSWDYMIWSMETFKSHLYTTVSFFYDEVNQYSGAQVFRTADGENWEAASQPGFGIDTEYTTSWDMIVYNERLYVAVNDFGVSGKPGIIMRSADGLNWEPVFTGTPETLQGNLIDKFGVFNGMIYATAVWTNGQIWRSPNGNPGTWELVKSDLGINFWSSSDMMPFKGYIYFSGYDGGVGPGGLRVWRSANGVDWETVGAGVLDDPANETDRSLAVYKDYLYLSTISYSDGGRIYRSRDGVNWELVIEKGFGNPNISEITSLFTYQGDLYATSNDTDNFETHANAIVWRTHTGNSDDWNQVNPGGLGDWTWSERCGQAVFKGDLYIANTWWNINKMIRY